MDDTFDTKYHNHNQKPPKFLVQIDLKKNEPFLKEKKKKSTTNVNDQNKQTKEKNKLKESKKQKKSEKIGF